MPGERRRQLAYDWPVLSIKQPWAQLIIEGAKDVEVRSWTNSYRGPIWIHTGQKIDDYAMTRFRRTDLFTGGLVGYANLQGIRPFCSSSWLAWRERHCDNADFNEELAKYGWILRDAKALVPPIHVKGRTGLFRLEEGMLEQLGRSPDLQDVLRTKNLE